MVLSGIGFERPEPKLCWSGQNCSGSPSSKKGDTRDRSDSLHWHLCDGRSGRCRAAIRDTVLVLGDPG
jgi:hypothetical protein